MEMPQSPEVEPLWVPVVGLGLSVLISATLETCKYWISYNLLACRGQQQLHLSIFAKAVRLPCVAPPENSEGTFDAHNLVNLLAGDVKNVADFLCFSFLIYESPLKMAIALTFLIILLGWQSVLAGIVMLSLLMIGNTIAGRRYSRHQGALIQHRDNRLRALQEMLQGIREIKFAAQELRWTNRINELRDTEMRAQWTICFWQIVFASLALMNPIVLSATCLSVFVLLFGHLSAATAFTSVSVLAAIEASISTLPGLLSFLLNARASVRRIQSYLCQPELNVNIRPSKEVIFENVTTGWPGCHSGPGILQELNLRFPSEALSMVTGPTGSGKSLLLAAILGEADILQGRISAPVAAPFELVSQDPDATNWLTESAVAFVSQSPWLQNTSVRDNILLGIPMNHKRYAQVVFACTLDRDFSSFPENDNMQITGKGANLSGGQRWRVCLARAIYSRAKTVLLDDIFSALDVHTRGHIYRHVLCSGLLRDRTCILATHHVELCRPHAQYVVHLDQGTVAVTTTCSHDLLTSLSENTVDQFLPQNSAQIRDDREINLPSTEIVVSKVPSIASKARTTTLTASQQSAAVASVFFKEGANRIQWSILGVAFLAYGGLMLSRVSILSSRQEVCHYPLLTLTVVVDPHLDR